jgi:O-antigen ligase
MVLLTTSLFVQVDVGQRAVDFVHYSRASAESRLVRWVSAGNAILDQPLLGVGFNNYAFLYGRYSVVEGINRQLYGSPHNMFVDIVTGTGVLGFLVFMTVIVRLYLQLRDNMNAVLPSDLKQLSRGIFLAYIFFLGSGLFDSFLFKVHHSSYLIVATWAMGSAIRRLRLGLTHDPEMAEFAATQAALDEAKK